MSRSRIPPLKTQNLIKACARHDPRQLHCLPLSLDASDLEQTASIVQRHRPLHRGTHLYFNGEPFEALFAIRCGSIKTYKITESGAQQVLGFYLRGELVGLDAIDAGIHGCSAVALETTSVCELPFTRLEELAARIPGLQHQLWRLMSREILRDHEMLVSLARRTAEERLAIVLLSLARRFGNNGLSTTRLRLPMPRSDLGNYLGLAPETVSRLFRRFQESGLLVADGREITLLDSEALQRLAEGIGPESANAATAPRRPDRQQARR